MIGYYDEAVNIYSPDGHLRQVGYAQEAVSRASTVVGLRTASCIVLGAEKNAMNALQIERTTRKIKKLDHHLAMTFTGLSADARILLGRAQVEAQSHRLNFDRPASVEYITRYLAKLKQQYTQRNGRRPFGVACFIGGYDEDGQAHLFQTDPWGSYHEWSANTAGRLGQTASEYLKKYSHDIYNAADEEAAIKHVLRAMLQSTPRDACHFELGVIKHRTPLEIVSQERISQLMDEINQDIGVEQHRLKRRCR